MQSSDLKRTEVKAVPQKSLLKEASQNNKDSHGTRTSNAVTNASASTSVSATSRSKNSNAASDKISTTTTTTWHNLLWCPIGRMVSLCMRVDALAPPR